MSIIPIPYIKQMKNNTFLIQFSDKFIVESIAQAQDGKICMWAGFIGPFSNWFRV